MLLFGARTYTIEGITIFPDHTDPEQFWYLPGPVQLARRRSDGRADLTFIKYKPAVAGSAKGGGFLMFAVNTRLDPIVERRILSRLGPVTRGKPKLAAVPFDEGTVRVVALDFQSGGDDAQAAPPPGTFRAVEKALGATMPSLHGDNTAAFSLTLSQEGAIILDKALREGTTPVGVVYDLKFTAMRPALDVKITADMKRVYEQFALGAEGQYQFINAGIEAGFEKLVQDGAIKIEVTDFVGAADRATREEWALNFFKESLLAKYFEPTLTPGSIVGGVPKPETLANVIARGQQMRPPQPTPPAKPKPGEPDEAKADHGESPTAGTGKAAETSAGLSAPTSEAAGDDPSPTAGTGGPPVSASRSDIGSAAAAGLKTSVAQAGAIGVPAGMDSSLAAAAGSGATAGSTPVVAFRFRGIRQEERKTITLSYNRSEAMQRSYAPQGFIGLLASDLDLKRGGHFVEVDLDDPYFREFEVSAEAPLDFARYGLVAADLSLSYGRPSDPGGPKLRDMRFTSADKALKSWKVFKNPKGDNLYSVGTQYHFDAQTSWEGANPSYDFPPREIEDRTLIVNPLNELGFIEAKIEGNSIDWGVVSRIEVELRYDDGAGWSPTRTIMISADALRHEWKIRTTRSAAKVIQYRNTFHMADRTKRVSNWMSSVVPLIVIDDPFPAAIDLTVLPTLDPSRTKMAIVDIAYDDPANGYKRRMRLKFSPQDGDKNIRLAVMDPAAKSFSYRTALVPMRGRMQQGETITTEDTLININD